MNKFLQSIFFLIGLSVSNILFAQTTLLSPTVNNGGFESGTTGWTLVNNGGGAADKWQVGTATSFAGTQSAYVSNDGGTSNVYGGGTSRVQHIYRSISFPTGEPTITLSFKWKCNGEGTSFDWDNLKVFVTGTVPTAGTESAAAAQVGATWYNQQTTWQSITITLPASLAGTTSNLIFQWKCDGSGAYQPPGAIDDVTLITSNTPVAPGCTSNTTQYPSTTYTPACNGSLETITSAGYATEYSVVSVTSGTPYIFSTDISTDYLTIANGSGGTPIYASGTTPVSWTATFTGTVRVYNNTNSSCGTNTSFRSRFVQCGTIPTAPSNDNCSGATAFPVVPTDGTCATLSNQSNAASTNSNVTPTGACTSNSGTPTNDVWFSFIATATSEILSATWVSGETDVYWQVFSGACASSMTALLCTDNNSGGTISGLTIGQKYYVRLYTYFTGTTVQNICIKAPPPPPSNDNCSGATAFPAIPTDGSCSSLSNQSTDAATNSGVTPTGTCTSNSGTPDDDVWFKFVATAPTIILKASWVSGETDVYWQVFSSACGSTMNSVFCSDADAGGTLSGLTVGQTYYIRMYTYYGSVTSVQNICLQTTPPNDNCSLAKAFPAIPTDGSCASLTNQTTIGTTNSGVTPTGACTSNPGTANDDVWFSFVATASDLVLNASWVSGETDVYFQVFSSTCGSTMTSLLCTDNDNGGIMSGLTIGQTYYVRMYTYTSGAYYTTQNLCIYNPCPNGTPANDLPCNAVNIPLGSIASGNNSCAYSSGEPATPSCWDGYTRNTVWFSFVAASSTAKVRTAPGSLRETQIAVYSGTCGSSMTLVACNDDAPDCGYTYLDISELSLTGLTAGVRYYIAVDGNNDSTGTFAITVVDGSSSYPATSGQECVTPITVCNSTIVVGDPGYQGIGFTCDQNNTNTSGPNCTTGERGSVWYKIIIDNPGTLYFNIVPNDYDGIAGDETDYDFLLWKVNGTSATSCAAINTNGGANTVACNYSFLGVTGLSASGNSPSPYVGYDAAYEPGATVAAGDIYLLAVQNYSNSTSGFTLDFTSTAAGVVNYGTPASVTWTGGANNTTWTTAVNWGGCTIPTCGINAIVSPSSSFQPTITAAMGAVVVRNITIDPGATLTLGPNSVLKICESMYNNGTIIADPTSTILFSDDYVSHTLNGTLSGSSRLGNLTITDAAGGTNCNVTANTNLELLGNFTTTNANSIFNLNSRNLTIAGNIINAAGGTTFTGTANSTVIFNGSTAQSYSPNAVAATPILTLNNIVMNHTGTGVSISATNTPNMVLGTSGVLTLTLGKIITPNAQEVVLTNTSNAAVTTGNANSYVEGNLRRYLAAGTTGSFDFPVGHATPGYERANINFTSSVAASPIQLLARFDPWGGSWPMPGAPGWGTECGVTYNAPYLNNGYWSIDASAATTGDYTMTLYNRSYTNSRTYFSIAKSPSSSPAWALNGNCVLANLVTAVQRTSMSGFSKFATIQNDITLPVELVEFKAEKLNEDVLLLWKTASEKNSNYFMVERSADGIHFTTTVGTIKAAGFSHELLSYQLIDENPLNGKNYYRLKQVDFDGSVHYSEIVLVTFSAISNQQQAAVSNLYPNPAKEFLYFDFRTPTDETIQIKIIDDLGRVLIDTKKDVKAGANTIETDMRTLANGIYVLKVISEKSNSVYTKKILKK